MILFLIITFTIGLFAYYLKYSDQSGTDRQFDYSRQDSLFEDAGKNQNLSGVNPKIKEKKVDSEPELLDFSKDKKEIRETPQEELKEKSINLNEADAKRLELLPGIGENTANKIIIFRTKVGRFTSLEQLMEVKGIGEKKFEKIKKYIYIR